MLTTKKVKTEFTNRALQAKCNALVIKLKKTLKLDKKQNNSDDDQI